MVAPQNYEKCQQSDELAGNLHRSRELKAAKSGRRLVPLARGKAVWTFGSKFIQDSSIGRADTRERSPWNGEPHSRLHKSNLLH